MVGNTVAEDRICKRNVRLIETLAKQSQHKYKRSCVSDDIYCNCKSKRRKSPKTFLFLLCLWTGR